MASDALHTYLNDHLAGSVTALKLLDQLVEQSSAPDLRQTFTTLRREIEEDQQTLADVLDRVGGTQSQLRQWGGALADKLRELKLAMDDPKRGTLDRLESLEMLALGILGKRALWRSLTAVTPARAELSGIDFARLIRRAEEQHERVEALRLESARRVLMDA